MIPQNKNDFFPVLSIAGSDNSGGAGIQADIKTFMAMGCFGLSAVASVTVQNPDKFAFYEAVAPALVYQQIEYAVNYCKPLAVKTGMLATVANLQVVAKAIADFRLPSLVMDPVLASSNGEMMTEANYVDILKSELIGHCFVITPNRMEAEILSGISIESYDDVQRAAHIIFEMGPKNVVIKGGHLHFDNENSVDTLFTGKGYHKYSFKKINFKKSFHGTGCTFSAALCASLARGFDIQKSIEYAKLYLIGAMQSSFFPGVLNHSA
ncbi:MAG: bifunctional hydroxymethylpyrimidine kinase/phosphomethylpyrimidine kinase [Spirochaetia bacterium]|nr:bifunctional hydroxymethylpyrimidine kinase/phosphomethylpyrimidine kinase [Spirochaetia bacterium]